MRAANAYAKEHLNMHFMHVILVLHIYMICWYQYWTMQRHWHKRTQQKRERLKQTSFILFRPRSRASLHARTTYQPTTVYASPSAPLHRNWSFLFRFSKYECTYDNHREKASLNEIQLSTFCRYTYKWWKEMKKRQKNGKMNLIEL